MIDYNSDWHSIPSAPSHFVGPSPYAGVRKCQFHTKVNLLNENVITKSTDVDAAGKRTKVGVFVLLNF